MIVAVGADLADVARFRRPSPAFLARVFSPAERTYARRFADPAERLAARFAAKEAVMKALGTGWGGGVAWRQVEVVSPRGGGAPVLKLSGKAFTRAKALGIRGWHLSLSHAGGFALAFVVAEG